MAPRCTYRLMGTIAQKITVTWHDTKLIIIPAHGNYKSNLSETRHDTKMFIPTFGEYSSNSFMTRHDTTMLIPTHGDYLKNYFKDSARRRSVRTKSWGVSLEVLWFSFGTQGGHTNHGGDRLIFAYESVKH